MAGSDRRAVAALILALAWPAAASEPGAAAPAGTAPAQATSRPGPAPAAGAPPGPATGAAAAAPGGTTPTAGPQPDVAVLEHKGRWESGYGATWYNVVGRVRNGTDHAVRYVKLRLEALDAGGKVVASTETYNETAEVLTVPEAEPQKLLAAGKIKPVAAGGEERFRGSFLKDETPAFETYRVRVTETPAVP
jgi:hypothetical protein